MIFTSGQCSSLETSFSPLVLILQFSCLDRCSTRCLEIASKDEADLQRDSNSTPPPTPIPGDFGHFFVFSPQRQEKQKQGLKISGVVSEVFRAVYGRSQTVGSYWNFGTINMLLKLELVLEHYHDFWSFPIHMCLLTCIRGESVSNRVQDRWSISLQDPCR